MSDIWNDRCDDVMNFHISCNIELFRQLNAEARRIIDSRSESKIILDIIRIFPEIESNQYIVNKYLPQMINSYMQSSI
jgi:hypothetical protein